MAWQKLEIVLPNFDWAKPLIEMINTLKELIKAIVAILETFLEFLQAVADPLVAVIKALVDLMNSILESLLEDMGAYALFVPSSKRLMTNFAGSGDITPGGLVGQGLFAEPYASAASKQPGMNEFLVNMNRYSGGNFGFCKTVWESLYDAGDVNRPQFSADDFVGGIVILLGTDFDPLGFLDELWKFMNLFHVPGSTAIPKFPRPKNLKARAVTTIGSGRFSSLLSWDAPEVPVYHLEDLGGTVYYPYRYAVLRGRNTAELLGSNNVVDWMGKRDIKQGDVFNGGAVEVIYEGPFDLTTISYFDQDIPADVSDSFYYAVAWRCKGFGATEKITEDGGVAANYWYISNVVRLVPYPILPASTPPDWARTPSLAMMIRPVAEFVRKIAAILENIANKMTGLLDMFKQYIEFLQQEILRYEQLINEILDALIKLLGLLDNLPTLGMYMRTFKGVGGNTFFLTDLMGSFTEEDAPPFMRGDEFTAGLVLMTGGPSFKVDALLASIDLLVGTGDSGMKQMLDEVGLKVTELEDNTFNADMSLYLPASPFAATQTTPDSDAVQCKCDRDNQPIHSFGADMKVVES